MEHFEKSVTLIVNYYIRHYILEYHQSPAQNWHAKDTALFLFSAIAIKSSTAQGGVTSTNILVDVCQFWTDNCQQEFAGGNIHPVLQADYIRYIYVFRNQVSFWGVLMVVDNGTTSDYSSDIGYLFVYGGICGVYLCCCHFGADFVVEKGRWTSFFEG
jgi:hypothetical protein